MTEPQQIARAAGDVAMGAGVASSPWWLVTLQDGLNVIAIAAGVMLAIIRIAISIREWRNPKE